MNDLGIGGATAAVIAIAFVATFQFIGQSHGLTPVDRPDACDAREDDCRAALRAQAKRGFEQGDPVLAMAAYRRAASGGDGLSALLLGRYHEEAHRRAVGTGLGSGTAASQATASDADDLPDGPAFDALVRSYDLVPSGPARAVAERALAGLWFARAHRLGVATTGEVLGATPPWVATGGTGAAEADPKRRGEPVRVADRR